MVDIDSLVGSAMSKYGLPPWTRPFIYRYARRSPVRAFKFATSLVDIKRKKGRLGKDYIALPNGTKFRSESLARLLCLFYYGEEHMADVERSWASGKGEPNAIYSSRFGEMAESDTRKARAIRNLIEGFGHKLEEGTDTIDKVFDTIGMLNGWNERIVATGLLIRYSYSHTFGIVFYKAFYPVSPELMRSFGKAFDDGGERWDSVEAMRIISSGELGKDELLGLARNVLACVAYSIESNMPLAKELGIEREVKLLMDISIAYPFEILKEHGMEIDVPQEVARAIRHSREFF